MNFPLTESKSPPWLTVMTSNIIVFGFEMYADILVDLCTENADVEDDPF